MRAFLIAPETELGMGYRLVLRAEALALGPDVAVEYLSSEAAQTDLRRLMFNLAIISLEVERPHARVKKGETSHGPVASVSLASRNRVDGHPTGVQARRRAPGGRGRGDEANHTCTTPLARSPQGVSRAPQRGHRAPRH